MEITLLIMKNHGIVFLDFCENPVYRSFTDYERRRRNPSFLKKLWPQNAEVLFFPSLDKLEGLQIITASVHGRFSSHSTNSYIPLKYMSAML